MSLFGGEDRVPKIHSDFGAPIVLSPVTSAAARVQSFIPKNNNRAAIRGAASTKSSQVHGYATPGKTNAPRSIGGNASTDTLDYPRATRTTNLVGRDELLKYFPTYDGPNPLSSDIVLSTMRKITEIMRDIVANDGVTEKWFDELKLYETSAIDMDKLDTLLASYYEDGTKFGPGSESSSTAVTYDERVLEELKKNLRPTPVWIKYKNEAICILFTIVIGLICTFFKIRPDDLATKITFETEPRNMMNPETHGLSHNFYTNVVDEVTEQYSIFYKNRYTIGSAAAAVMFILCVITCLRCAKWMKRGKNIPMENRAEPVTDLDTTTVDNEVAPVTYSDTTTEPVTNQYEQKVAELEDSKTLELQAETKRGEAIERLIKAYSTVGEIPEPCANEIVTAIQNVQTSTWKPAGH
jgi:hypothetical protein